MTSRSVQVVSAAKDFLLWTLCASYSSWTPWSFDAADPNPVCQSSGLEYQAPWRSQKVRHIGGCHFDLS